MLKIKNWIVDEKKHVRFYHDWNDKEVMTCVCLFMCVCVCVSISVCCKIYKEICITGLLYGSVERLECILSVVG